MIINLTPHAIVVGDRTIPPSGVVARVASTARELPPIEGLPVVETAFGETTGLPPETLGTWLVVSQVVQTANPGRKDLLRPDTGPESVIRDAEGKILGVKRLTR